MSGTLGASPCTANLIIEGSESVALVVREELARRRLSRQWLADEARVSLSTLEKALSGRRPFTLSTVVRLEDALGTSLRSARAGSDAARGPVRAGVDGRLRPAGGAMAGGQLSHLRPSFSEPGAVFAYLTSISWDDGQGPPRLQRGVAHRQPV